MTNIIKPELMPVRTAWRHETDFSDWLFKKENLDLLSKLVNINMQPIGRENKVGTKRSDILAEEIGTGRKIVIENQFGTLDDCHFGKAKVYRSHHKACVIIWIAENAKSEHIKTIIDENENFNGCEQYVIKLEVLKAGAPDSIIPVFSVLVKPENTQLETNVSSNNSMICKWESFWNEFQNYAFTDPTYKNMFGVRHSRKIYLDLSTKAKYHFYIENSKSRHKTKSITAGFYILPCKTDTKLYDSILNKRNEIEADVGESFTWSPVGGTSKPKAKRFELHMNIDYDDENNKQVIFKWYKEKLILLQKTVVSKYLNTIKE